MTPSAERSIACYLPDDVRAHPAVGPLVAAIDDMLAPILDIVDGIDAHLAVDFAPASILEWLAECLGVDDGHGASVGQYRILVAEVGEIYGWWGTARGLAALLRAETGCEPEILDNGGVAWSATPLEEPRADQKPTVVIRLYEPHADIIIDRLDALVASAVPAHVTYQIEIVRTQQDQ